MISCPYSCVMPEFRLTGLLPPSNDCSHIYLRCQGIKMRDSDWKLSYAPGKLSLLLRPPSSSLLPLAPSSHRQVIKTSASRWAITESLFDPSLSGSSEPGLIPLLLSSVMDGCGAIGGNVQGMGGGGGGGYGLGGGVGAGGGPGGAGGVVSAEVMRQRAALEAIAVVGGGSCISGKALSHLRW